MKCISLDARCKIPFVEQWREQTVSCCFALGTPSLPSLWFMAQRVVYPALTHGGQVTDDAGGININCNIMRGELFICVGSRCRARSQPWAGVQTGRRFTASRSDFIKDGGARREKGAHIQTLVTEKRINISGESHLGHVLTHLCG